MSDRRRGLGRGLQALIPNASREPQVPGVGTATAERGVAAAKVTALRDSDVSRETSLPSRTADAQKSEPEAAALQTPVGAFFAELPLDSITPNPQQPRRVFDEDALAELVTSIKEVGLLQPVVVRQLGPESFQLIMGERRLRATREAGLDRIPAIIRATEDDKLLLDALLENLHRAQLNPVEEALAYDQLLKDFGCTHDQLADRIGRSRPQVSNTLRLLKLPMAVQKRVSAGVLSGGHARALLGLEDSEAQEHLAKRIVQEGLSVRTTEEIVKMMESEPKKTAKPKGPRAGSRMAPALSDLASRLSDRFETRVKVDLGQKKGKITVEFASVEDLERILGTLAPGEGRVLEKSLSEQDGQDEES
ncbi:ParB/RepB/Spo0J family partition protein [Streptomyces sp. NBC_00237]|uniref:ParB/RepB/Spo0J family partition protein n=1 Tax=Streptomyces sp. NBC_00237 TaxID=2975687 RepID=UPI002258859F|nr:ParB/RepB/Spo0J family partition protein [Streptomyces sp. NBC_00237]MCX5200052.1 ParB/RepB/Spo0J family partition protein [Streptomyces sp. NBC_00237]